MSKHASSSIQDSTRVFVGGVGVMVLAWLWWNGYVFRPVAEPMAAAIAGPQLSDGHVGGNDFADLVAKMLTGALWTLGEIIWIAFTVAWGLTKFLAFALTKWLLSFTDSGREFLSNWDDDDATVVPATPAGVVDPVSGNAVVASRIEKVEAEIADLRIALAAAQKNISKTYTAVNRNRRFRKAFEESKTFAELKRVMTPATEPIDE